MLSTVTQMCKEGCRDKAPCILPGALGENKSSDLWCEHLILWEVRAPVAC
jgi:hypothetical protein